ncbi:MAG: neutral/alkaline non-lysosomal ceramidase N-terminal domain-containing protein [Gemmatimonadota bacterium]|nr:neutral/alkaline non-lysosomal ceramidase N-terminal domain-containing protein [Gemmatimonadota bacterium]
MEELQLFGGFARTDITPELGILLMGYPDPDRKAESVRDPLQAHALVLRQGETTAVLISLTVCILDDAGVESIRRGIQEQTRIPADSIVVCTVQTHSAPCTMTCWGWCDRDETYVDLLVSRSIKAAVKASQNLKKIQVGIGTTESDVGVNRRAIKADHTVGLGYNPWGIYDPEMTVVCFQCADGPLATLIHYGAHPTVLSSKSRAISRDWPGVMIDRVEDLTGAPALFVNGAVGDIAPRSNILGSVGDGEAALLEVGTRAGMDAMRAIRAIKEFRNVELGVTTGAYQLPYRPLPPEDEASRNLAEAEPHRNEYGRGMCEYKYWQAVVRSQQAAPVSGKNYLQVILRLGPIAIVPFPGEPFAEIVLRLRDFSPAQYTLCASTSCGSNGYFVTRESLDRGGYEVWVARAMGAYTLAENIDDVLVEENMRLLTEAYA